MESGGRGARRDAQAEHGDSRVRLISFLACLECRGVGSSDRVYYCPRDSSRRADELNLQFLAVELEVSVVTVDGDSSVGMHAPVSDSGGASDLVLHQELFTAVEEPDTTLD